MKPGSAYSHPALKNPELRRVAVGADCDPRTVVRYLRGKPIQSTRIAPIERSLVSCGYGRLVKPSAREARDSTPPSAT